MTARRWLTPNAPPEHRQYVRRVVIPADIAFLAPVSGALVELTFPSAWEKDGELTPEETALIFSGIYQQFLPFENPPPEWETPDDLDGTPEQPWYDDLADWIIAGFLAITFTPQAAIVYQATVPRLRVAIRTGNLGALFRVLINGVEVWTGDSYGPITDLIEEVFDMSAETVPYTVRIEHNGIGEGHGLSEAKLEVVREGALAEMVQTILRADPEGCGIQWSLDDGGTWETIDLATCITGLAQDAIQDAIDNGVIDRPGGQPPPSEPPAPGQCASWHVTLVPGARWLLPSPVNYNDTVVITGAAGGWSIGELAWYCPDGSRYLVGACSEELKTHLESDLLNPDAYHMEPVALIGETYVNVTGAPHVVTETTTEADLFITANTGLTGVPSGEISFDVELCRDSGWVYVFDFTAGEQGWTVDGLKGHYESGVGFVSDHYDFHYQLKIDYTLPAGVYVSAEWHIHNDQENNQNCNYVMGDEDTLHLGNVVSGWSDLTDTLPISAGAAYIQPFEASGQTPTFIISSVTFRGMGLNPFL